jgi:hypothetical protein
MNDFSLYFTTGWEHIITFEALDHILFIVALSAIYLLKDWKQVLILITAFTIGHTITLALSSLQLVTVSIDWVEFLVPVTIVLTALSNLFIKNFSPRNIRINYFLALFFGLIHGMAFAETLRFMLASDQSFAFSLFSFSLGLELGQILVVMLILLLAHIFVTMLKVSRREWVIFLSAVAMALAIEMAADRRPWKKEETETGELPANFENGLTYRVFSKRNLFSTLNLDNAHEERFNDGVGCLYKYSSIGPKHAKQSGLKPWKQV